MTTIDYNTDQPTSLLVRGLLQGEAVHVNTHTVQHPTYDRRVYIAQTLVGHDHDNITRGGKRGWVAIKVTDDLQLKPPRNVRNEARLMANMSHPNVIALWNAYLVPTSTTPINRFMLFMPLYDLSLSTLLDNPSFVPRTNTIVPHQRDDPFFVVANSLTKQLLEAVAYIHDKGISHRDINPNNIVLNLKARLVLIDFGISIDKQDDQTVELPGQMEFQIGTQPYRAPELIFGSRDYDAQAVDLWALATTLAEFLTPVTIDHQHCRQSLDSDDSITRNDPYDDDSDSLEQDKPRREKLFQPFLTDFSLAASMFKLLGTPTSESWPESDKLPSFKYFKFNDFKRQPLAISRLIDCKDKTPIIDIVEQMLTYPTQQRLKVEKALNNKIINWENFNCFRPLELNVDGKPEQSKQLEQALLEFLDQSNE
ncbi:hypothetical protein OIO90_006409 [Microbotryomycetes sp. JL221]|nr:hypothetical protein OIO90_006409 [Microbotryomycetes sp. JL221]